MKLTKNKVRDEKTGLSKSVSVSNLIKSGFCAALVLSAADLVGQEIVSRPLSPQEIHVIYQLPEDTGISGGLFNVGRGTSAYLEVQVEKDINVTNVVWEIVDQPLGSTAQLAVSPLGVDVPVFAPGRREDFDVPVSQGGRTLLIPDEFGIYVVRATVTMDGDDVVVDQWITSAGYVGVGKLISDGPEGVALDTTDLQFPQCSLCHLGQAEKWLQTKHASKFRRNVDGVDVGFYAERCNQCHTVGYNDAVTADNHGFDDVAADLNWELPSPLQAGNWDALPQELKNLANIQCESCHGPGGEHFTQVTGLSALNGVEITAGNYKKEDLEKMLGTILNTPTISLSAGDCAQCHDDEPYHTKNIEWNLSNHATATRYPTGEGRETCVVCHSGIGFIERIDKGINIATDPNYRDKITDPTWEAITCQVCHDPHDATNPHQLRQVGDVTLFNGDVITQGGTGKLCMNCHISRRNAEEYVQSYHSHYGPHGSPQTDMLAGKNAIDYGHEIGSSGHLNAVDDACAVCHMQENDVNDDPLGGHTWMPNSHNGGDVYLTAACANCHGPVDTFNFPQEDYNEDGVVEGIQTEIEQLMYELGLMLPPLGDPDVNVTSNYTPAQLKAAYNYLFVEEDGSMGIHNASYATGLLKAAMVDLVVSIDTDQDGLLDEWEMDQFGSIDTYDGDDDPDGDMLSNLQEQIVDTDPMLTDTDGDNVDDYVEVTGGYDPLNDDDFPISGQPRIMTAVEIQFISEVGKTYRVQKASSVDGGWVDVTGDIPGGGDLIQSFFSIVGLDQEFYRIVELP